MSSILDALRKLEQEKVDTSRPIEIEYNDEVAERDLIGSSTRVGLPAGLSGPWLGAIAALIVLALVAGSAGGAVMWMRANSTPINVASSTGTALAPVVQTASVLPSTPPAAELPSVPAPAALPTSTPAPVTQASDSSPAAPPAPMPVSEPAVPGSEASVVPMPFVPETSPRVAEARAATPYTTVHERPAAPEKRATRDAIPSKAQSSVVPAPGEVAPSEKKVSLPEPATYEPVETTSAPLPDVPADRLLGGSGAAEEPASSVVTPAPAEEQANIKVNMPRPANKTRPYDSAIINMQAVFLNEIIPGTNSRLVKVREDGVEVLNETTNKRYYIPF